MKNDYFEKIALECERELNREAAKACRLVKKAKSLVENNNEVVKAYNKYCCAEEKRQEDEENYVQNCSVLFKKIFFATKRNLSSLPESLSILSYFQLEANIDLNNLSYEDCINILHSSDFEKIMGNYNDYFFKTRKVSLYEYATTILNRRIATLNNSINELKSNIEKLDKYPKFLLKFKYFKSKVDSQLKEYKGAVSEKTSEKNLIADYQQLIYDSEDAFHTLYPLTDPIPEDERNIKKCEKEYEKIFKEKLEQTEQYIQAKELRSRDHRAAIISKHFNENVITNLAENPEFLIDLGRVDALNYLERNKKKIKDFLIESYIPEATQKTK